MKCDCLKVVSGKLAEHMKSKAGNDAEAVAKNTALMLTPESLESVLQIPFRIKGSKKGFTRERGKEMGVNASYCPFCARSTKRYVVGEDQGIEAAHVAKKGGV